MITIIRQNWIFQANSIRHGLQSGTDAAHAEVHVMHIPPDELNTWALDLQL